ncbi:hypothetical protein BaRGS_00027308 [Batillaria attramentaria]|uniref:Uncharacterized protein n=1 Tax=Batillaria attramentaria TaxID=370345 RepID=A0ABD0K3T3_9CAEN
MSDSEDTPKDREHSDLEVEALLGDSPSGVTSLTQEAQAMKARNELMVKTLQELSGKSKKRKYESDSDSDFCDPDGDMDITSVKANENEDEDPDLQVVKIIAKRQYKKNMKLKNRL